MTLTTDASSTWGWGGHMNNLTVQGRWSFFEQLQHINCLEMEAVMRSLNHFLPHLQNKNVLIRTDNTTVVQYINKRGYEISQSVSTVLESLETGIGAQNKIESSSYFRENESASRFIEQAVSEGNRVVSEQIDCVEDIPSLEFSSDGPLCHSREQENTTLLHVDTSPRGFCAGCPVNCMAEHVCVCIPTSEFDFQSSVSHESVPLHSDLDSTQLAKTTLVSTSVTNVDCRTIEITSIARSTFSSKGEDKPPRPSDFRSDCMAHIDKCLITEGFSEKSRKLLTASWRKGTQRDYRSKFKMFSNWCFEQQIDPYAASLKDCINFLAFKYHQGAAYRTIAGYRSMMSSVLPHVGKFPVGQHPYVIRLLKGVFNGRPPTKKLVPEWDLPLVLGCLKKAPFEPLREAPLKYLTWKTCFLVAVTSFRRCSDFQSLKLGEGSVNVQKKGIIFIRHGLSKQDRAGHTPTTIFIPSFPDNKKLDPKRCLAIYLNRTENFRRKKGTDVTKLFLATKSPNHPVSSQTISKWIVKTIKFAYKGTDKSVKKVTGHSTRSVGPSWALFKGTSMKSVLESVDWSQETTFVKHYLSCVNVDFLSL